jgi:hypothetical protein
MERRRALAGAPPIDWSVNQGQEYLIGGYPWPMAAMTAVDSGTVLAAITVVVLPIAAIAFARSAGAWRRVGKGAFAIEQEPPPRRASATPDRRLQEAEARQMLEAKSYLRLRSGQEPIDIEAELGRLLEPGCAEVETEGEVDEELREEVRRLVIARNERRMRRGEEPLDVEAEVERQLAEIA